MKKTILLFACIIGFCVHSDIMGADELPAEIKAIMDVIIQAHEAETGRMRKGTGLASVSKVFKAGEYVKEENNLAHFWFKGQSTRTDISPADSKAPDENIQRSMADNGEFYIRYTGLRGTGTAMIQHTGVSGFAGELGEDFSPHVFFDWVGGPLSQTLRYLKDQRGFKLEIQFVKDALLKFEGSYNEKIKFGREMVDARENFYFLLNANHSYRIEEYHYEQENINGPDSWSNTNMKIDWHNSGLAEAYPKSVKFDRIVVRSTTQFIKDPPPDAPFHRRSELNIKIDVKELQSDINIEDDIFTLEGMGIKHGTRIIDEVAGIFYTYGNEKDN